MFPAKQNKQQDTCDVNIREENLINHDGDFPFTRVIMAFAIFLNKKFSVGRQDLIRVIYLLERFPHKRFNKLR